MLVYLISAHIDYLEIADISELNWEKAVAVVSSSSSNDNTDIIIITIIII